MGLLLRICGIAVTLFGFSYIMMGFGHGPWNPGEQMFVIGEGLANLIIGIGVTRLSKLAMYCVFPLVIFMFWVMRLDLSRGNPIILGVGLLFAVITICSVIYLTQDSTTK
jgi:hypothetical protein